MSINFILFRKQSLNPQPQSKIWVAYHQKTKLKTDHGKISNNKIEIGSSKLLEDCFPESRITHL